MLGIGVVCAVRVVCGTVVVHDVCMFVCQLRVGSSVYPPTAISHLEHSHTSDSQFYCCHCNCHVD